MQLEPPWAWQPWWMAHLVSSPNRRGSFQTLPWHHYSPPPALRHHHRWTTLRTCLSPATRHVVQHAWDALNAHTPRAPCRWMRERWIGIVDSTSTGNVSAVTETPLPMAHQRFIIGIRLCPSQPEFQNVQNVVRNITPRAWMAGLAHSSPSATQPALRIGFFDHGTHLVHLQPWDTPRSNRGCCREPFSKGILGHFNS